MVQAVTKGCLAGSAVCFISWKGDVYPCGYFPLSAGSIAASPLSDIWRESPLFAQLRDTAKLEGKCGICGNRASAADAGLGLMQEQATTSPRSRSARTFRRGAGDSCPLGYRTIRQVLPDREHIR